MVDDPDPEGVEAPRPHRNVVEQKRIDHDPHHRPQREDGPVRDRVRREGHRHAPCGHGNDEGDDQAGERSLPCGPAENAKEHENRGHGQGGYEER